MNPFLIAFVEGAGHGMSLMLLLGAIAWFWWVVVSVISSLWR